MTAKTYRIGRAYATGPRHYAFTLGRDDSGLITITDEDAKHGPSTAERTAVLRYFGTPQRELLGSERQGALVDDVVVLQPGTREHFDVAAHHLPRPFGLMPGGQS